MNNLQPIPDFEGYFADREGNIYTTLKQGCKDRYDLSKRTEPRLLKVRPLPKGYNRVYMRRESTGKREDVYVHRIIAELFVPNPNGLETVNHKNSCRTDNRVENLEWMTMKENLDHAMKFGYNSRDELGRFKRKEKV